MKRKVFIGSSTEELDIAEKVKSVLDSEFDVTIWNESLWDKSVFRLNQNYLNDLLKASLRFEFGILIGTKDDKVTYRGDEVLQPRDNVIFELGLFLGRLGSSKCAFLVDKDVKFPSDLKGISLAIFDKEDDSSIVAETEKIKELFKNSHDDEINFFPSATLAAVYYENFIVPICKHIINNRKGVKINNHVYTKCYLTIVIPDRISSDVNSQLSMLKRKISTDDASLSCDGRPRTIQFNTLTTKDDTLEIVDFPTALAGINHSISNLLPQDFSRLTSD